MAPRPAGRRPCIFCGAPTALTKEHFTPQWMHPLLPPLSDTHRVQMRTTDYGGATRRRLRQGGVRSIQMKCVCANCNGVWMSGLEEAARTAITRLVRGERHNIDAESLLLVQQWCAMKVFVADAEVPAASVATPQDREAFRATRTIPDYLRIRLGQTAGAGWASQFFRQTMSNSPNERPRFQVLVAGMGQLLVVATLDRTGGAVDLFAQTQLAVVLPSLNAEVAWPPNPLPLTDQDATAITTTLDQLKANLAGIIH